LRIRTKRSSTRSVAALIAATLIASVLTLVAAPSSAATAVTITTRSTLSGTDRYNTSEKVHTAAAAKNGTFTNLILASGDSFPDALSAVALAEVQDAGVLLLPADGTMTAAAVAKAVAATTIFIVGGTSALSSAVETKLKTVASAGGAGKASTAIVRYAGTNRYSTSAIVANAITAAGVASHDNKKTAILVSGANFADAVSASMLVSGPTTATATTALPIILTEPNSLPMVAEVALANLAIKKIIVIGGTNAVSAAVATKAGAGRTVVRISGTDRYDTAAKVADLAVKTVATGGFGMNKREVYLAEMSQASGGADALSAGSLVNEDGSVLLGTSGGTLPAATVAWLGANNAGASGLTVGIIGGTGGMGKGFALRWAQNHDIIIGSRDATRASESAVEYTNLVKESFGDIKGTITGNDNVSVAKESDVLILSIPYENIDSVCSGILSEIKDTCVVVSPIVPMTKTDVGFECVSIKDNKPFSYKLVSNHMKDKSKLVSAFHVISEKKLVNPTLELDYDIFVCGDNNESVQVVNGLIDEIKGLRSIYLGPIELSYLAEMATPLLLNAMIRNKIKNPGIKII
jgi:NADPH-dependent F420 reductase